MIVKGKIHTDVDSEGKYFVCPAWDQEKLDGPIFLWEQGHLILEACCAPEEDDKLSPPWAFAS